MTKRLDHAFEMLRQLPPEQQDDLARDLLRLAGDDDSLIMRVRHAARKPLAGFS